jgi:uncharacterized membrane protein
LGPPDESAVKALHDFQSGVLGMKQLFEEKNIRRAFEISLVLKGIFAVLEIIGGVLAYLRRFLLRSRKSTMATIAPVALVSMVTPSK